MQICFWRYVQVYFPSMLPASNPKKWTMFNTSFFGKPDVPESVKNISAITRPKIQFFEAAVLSSDVKAMGRLMADKKYQGSQLFVLDPAADGGTTDRKSVV